MPAQRYIERPAQVEAIPAHEVLDAANHAWEDLPAWIRAEYDQGRMLFLPDEIVLNGSLGQSRVSGTQLLVYTGQVVRVMSDAEFHQLYTPLPKEAP